MVSCGPNWLHTHYVAEADLELLVFLHLPSNARIYRHGPPCPAQTPYLHLMSKETKTLRLNNFTQIPSKQGMN